MQMPRRRRRAPSSPRDRGLGAGPDGTKGGQGGLAGTRPAPQLARLSN
jgi:hypothetical protein